MVKLTMIFSEKTEKIMQLRQSFKMLKKGSLCWTGPSARISRAFFRPLPVPEVVQDFRPFAAWSAWEAPRDQRDQFWPKSQKDQTKMTASVDPISALFSFKGSKKDGITGEQFSNNTEIQYDPIRQIFNNPSVFFNLSPFILLESDGNATICGVKPSHWTPLHMSGPTILWTLKSSKTLIKRWQNGEDNMISQKETFFISSILEFILWCSGWW